MMKKLLDEKRCSYCYRLVLSLLNVTILTLGLTVIGLTLWLWFDKKVEIDLRSNLLVEYNNNIDMDETKAKIRTWAKWSSFIALLIGLTTVLLGFLGIVGGIRENRRLISWYLILVTLCLFFEMSIEAVIYCYKPMIKHEVKEYVRLAERIQMLPDMDVLKYRVKLFKY
ncbi:unnamed protein product [Enterobius vermicularis]|uniref:Tetraspanin n=1 Tax=Enterobius vermicularis TaxID=51028 RepID=A0A0N4VQZ6_ENTVE|nr:unnamed protein product [Enterobius vermicularis]